MHDEESSYDTAYGTAIAPKNRRSASQSTAFIASLLAGVTHAAASLHDVRLHHVTVGQGEPVVFGMPQCSTSVWVRKYASITAIICSAASCAVCAWEFVKVSLGTAGEGNPLGYRVEI